MRVAILSSFPPEVCGIGEYAAQQALRLEREGHTVDRIALDPLRWQGWTRAAVAGVERRLREADRAIVHYQVGLFLDKTRWPRVLRFVVPHRALLRLARRVPRFEVVVHESSWRVWRGPGERLQYPFVRRFFAAAPRLVFHTEAEKEAFQREFRLDPMPPAQVVPHHADFVAYSTRSRAEARRALGVPAGERMALCIGFYAPPKGFEDAAERFAALRKAGRLPPEARLRVVTSVREKDDRQKQEALERFRRAADADPAGGVTVDVRYVGNEEFDDWLVASDLVVLPYRSSFSSGVAARAALLGRPMAATAAGGLPEQVGPGGRVYRTPGELDAILVEALGSSPSPKPSGKRARSP